MKKKTLIYALLAAAGLSLSVVLLWHPVQRAEAQPAIVDSLENPVVETVESPDEVPAADTVAVSVSEDDPQTDSWASKTTHKTQKQRLRIVKRVKKLLRMGNWSTPPWTAWQSQRADKLLAEAFDVYLSGRAPLPSSDRQVVRTLKALYEELHGFYEDCAQERCWEFRRISCWMALTLLSGDRYSTCFDYANRYRDVESCIDDLGKPHYVAVKLVELLLAGDDTEFPGLAASDCKSIAEELKCYIEKECMDYDVSYFTEDLAIIEPYLK